jgi:hypothetical protein
LERVAERVLTAGTLDEALGMPCTSGVPTMLLAGVVDLCLARVLLRRFRKGGYGADGILVAAAD